MSNLRESINFNLVKHITAEEYFTGEEYAASMFKAKYSHTKDDGSIESPAETFWRVSSGLAAMEDNEELESYYRSIWFSLMWNGWFRPGGSVISGVGSKTRQSLLNCTTLPLNGDSIEDIAACDYTVMKCAAFRQGLGIDGSSLRPRGARVNNAALESTGVVPWIAKLVDNGKYVGQKGRMPALLISLKDYHPDIFEFITSKTKSGQLENCNISIQISNDFMNAVKNDLDWELYFEFENDKYPRISRTVKAKELFQLIADTAYTSAEPGVQFIDQLRAGSMVHQLYLDTDDKRFQLISTNACSEKPLPPYGVCNLLSINMEMFSTNLEEYIDELEYIVPILVRLSDNVVSYELNNKLSPLPEQAWILNDTREIGMGITNMHGWLLKQQIPYASEKGNDVVENFFKYYAHNVFKSSVSLGIEKGSAPAWGRFNNRYKALMNSVYFKNIFNEFYDSETPINMQIPHMRNMAHMSIAPSGSISGTFPESVLSYGAEPFTGPYYWKKTRAINKGIYTHYFIIPNKVRQYLLNIITDPVDLKKIQDFPGSALDDEGVIGNELVGIINKYVPKELFTPAHLINPLDKVELMSRIYKWMDASISITYNLPTTATKQVVYDIYMSAFDKGVRAVAVYVEGSREGILIFDDPVVNAKKFKDGHSLENLCANGNRPTRIIFNCAPKRPDELPCDIYITSIKGVQWTVLVGLLEGQLFEIFCGQSEDLPLPQSCKNGIIRKQGDGIYELEVRSRRSPIIFKDLAGVLMSDNEKALTRLLSLNLRHGVPPQYIVQQLKKTNGNITAFSTAISRVLSKYVNSYTLKGNEMICPVCGQPSLIFEEGCIKCADINCTYSRCGG